MSVSASPSLAQFADRGVDYLFAHTEETASIPSRVAGVHVMRVPRLDARSLAMFLRTKTGTGAIERG
jgi:hypothetical protein